MTRWGRKAATCLAAVIAAAGLTVVSPAGAAYAGTKCSDTFGCSMVQNGETGANITARHNWTCSWGSTGSSSTGCTSGAAYTVPQYTTTPAGQDWDVLQVDAGWCYKVRFVNWWGKDWTETYDRRGNTALYVKIEDGSVGIVLGQSNTRCP